MVCLFAVTAAAAASLIPLSASFALVPKNEVRSLRQIRTLRTSSSLFGTSESSGNILDSTFTGGYGASEEEESEAASIAAKIKSVNDFPVWIKAPRARKGSQRPRHRAWGGEGESPVQEKAGFDDTLEASPEKWLTQEDMNKKFRIEGVASDVLFCALAGSGKYAERDSCESKIAKWRMSGKFDETAFMADVKKGRTDLAVGYATFVGLNLFAVLNIALPTNPVASYLYSVIEILRQKVGLEYLV